MADERLYVLTDINIPITLSGDITIADVVDMTVRLVKDGGSTTIEFKKSNEEIGSDHVKNFKLFNHN